jgi:hypothetical protein
MARQNSMMGKSTWWRKLLTSWWPGIKDRARKGQGPNTSSKDTAPMT